MIFITSIINIIILFFGESMNITIITSSLDYIPPYGFGAVERLWFQLGLQFVITGNKVTFISKRPEIIPAVDDYNKISIKFIKGFNRTGSLLKNLFLDLLYSFNALRALDKTDILILNNFWTPILCKFFKEKYKIVAYNVARFPKKQFKYYKQVDRFYCVSTAVYKELIKQTPKIKNRAIVISNPVNTNVFFYNKKNKNNAGNISVLYTGRIHPEKGLDILVKAINLIAEKYSDLRLVLTGPVSIESGGGGKEYKNKLNSLAINFKIDWREPVSEQEKLRDIINECDIFCYPSIAEKGESFGVAPLEAMATGTATIVSALECFKDFIVNGKNGLIFNHRLSDAEKLLAEKIELLIDDPILREKLGYEGAKTALNFSNEKIATLYIQDFKELLNKTVNA